MTTLLKKLARQTLPPSVHERLRQRMLKWQCRPPVGWIRFGSLRRLEPINRNWGEERGGPIDRYYIERFLEQNAGDVHGRVLEIGDNAYTLRFGGSKLEKSDVLHYTEGNPQATFVGDLTNAPQLPSDAFDCIVLTQTLQLIYDLRAAIATCHRVLKPGGVILATVPGITPICHQDSDTWGDYWCWSFTKLSARKLFEEHFGTNGNVKVESFGNVLTSIGFLHGVGLPELTQRELDYHDRDYQFLITIRAQKVGGPG